MNFTYDFAQIDNRVPMIDFLESLSVKERAKIVASIDKLIELKNHGLQPKTALSKHLEDGIFEETHHEHCATIHSRAAFRR